MSAKNVPGVASMQMQQQQGNSQRPPISSDEYQSIGSGGADMKAASIAVRMCPSLTGTRNCQPEMSYGGLYDADLGGGGSINGSVGGSDGGSGGNKIF